MDVAATTMEPCLPRVRPTAVTDLGMPDCRRPRSVLLAAPRGYCAGVDRAVITVEKALDLYGPPVYVRKQIVHNKHVVHTLENRGAIFVEELDEVPEGSTVVFSAHGVSPAVHAQAAERSLKTIDATCPLVTKVHNEARRFADDDYDILLIGHEGHEEVEGTAGEAPDQHHLVQSPDDVADVEVRDPEQGRVAVADHPVGRRDDGDGRTGSASSSPTCSTRRRTTSATPPRTVSRRSRRSPTGADLVLVVGSGNSSNSVRLVEVALESGARRRTASTTRARSTRPGSRASSRSASRRVRRCPRTWSMVCSTS